MESTSKEEDLLPSKLTKDAGVESLVKCLSTLIKSTEKEEKDKNLKLLANLLPLTSGCDISSLNSLLLPNGEVKDWMMTAVQSGNQDGLILWSELVRVLGKTLHQPGEGTVLLNSLLHVVEKAFKHSANNIRIAAYRAWMVLMDNFGLNHAVLTTKRRIKLIVRPLIGSISNRTEEQVQLKFDAWWYYFGLLGPALENQIESVVIPFLKFCFSSTVSEANGTSKPTKEPQSPAKKYSSLRKKCVEATAILFCGLNAVKASYLDISNFKDDCLTKGLLKPTHFTEHYSTILQCVTEIYDTLQIRSKLETEQLSAVMKTLGNLVEVVSNDQELKGNSQTQTAIGHYLAMVVNLIIVSSKCDLSHALNLSIIQNVSKIPDEILASAAVWEFEKSAEKESPALSMIEQMFKNDLLSYVFSTPNGPDQEKYFALLQKFLKAACLVRPRDGLNVIDEALEKIKKIEDVKVKKNAGVNFWKVIAHVYIAYVDKFNEINQHDRNWSNKLKPKLTASFALLTAPISNAFCLESNSKVIWKLWIEAFNKFSDKAPLLVAYKTLEAEDLIAGEVLKKLTQSNITLTEWNNLSTVISQHLIQAIPYQSLSQESQGVAGGTELNPLGRIHRIVEVLLRLLEIVPKFKDRDTSVVLIKQLVHLLTHVTSQEIQRPLLKLISPAFEIVLDKELIYALGTEFESKAKNAHEVIVNRLQSRYDGKFDLALLDDLRPFFRAAFKHKNREIRNKTHQMWQLTFAAANIEEKDIPNDINDLLKEILEGNNSLSSNLSHSNSELGGTGSTGFAIPLAFSNIFNKKSSTEKTTDKSGTSKKPVSPMVNGGKIGGKKGVKAVTIDEENSQDFVKISSPKNVVTKRRLLTDHQKEVLRQRKDDIPALYSELSRDDSMSMSAMFQSQLSKEDSQMSQEPLSLTCNEESKTASDTLTDKSDTENTLSSDKPLIETPEQKETESASTQEADNQNTEVTSDKTEENTDEKSTKSKRKGTKPKKIDTTSPLKKKKGKPGRPPKKKAPVVQSEKELTVDVTDLEEKMRQGLKRKATSPIPDESLSDIGHNLLFKPEVHVSRLSPTHLEMTKVSPVKVITDDPLVIQPAVIKVAKVLQLNNHEDELIESSQPMETSTSSGKNSKKSKRRHSLAVNQTEAKRPTRKASQKLNMSLSSISTSDSQSKNVGKENEGPQPLLKTIKVKTNKYGESALHVAIKKGDYDKAKNLLDDSAADVNMKDNAGWTPLHEAAVHYGARIQDILELLITKGADVNARANNGSTPLHDAIMFLPEECIKYLISKGADPDIANNEGKTPRSLLPVEKWLMCGLSNTESVPVFDSNKMDVQKKVETIDEIPAEKIVSTESVDESRITEDPIDIPMEEDEQDDKLNDSSNSVLATPLEPDEELEDIKSVPSSLNEEADEIPKDVPEFTAVVEKKTEPLVEKEDSNSTSLIKPPLPVFKNISNNSTSASNKATVLSNVFSSRGARLLKMSKEKISSSPSFSSQDSPPTNSYSQLSLMSPRPDVKSLNNDMTPTQPKKEAWQKYVPSPSDASPSSSILKRSASSLCEEALTNGVSDLASKEVEAPPLKRRRVQFKDPPVSDQVVIPRCPSGKATRQKLQESRFNRDMFLSSVAKDLSNVVTDMRNSLESDNNSCGLYEATPPITNNCESGSDSTPSNCIYPSLNSCDEPVSSILHNLTTKTWHKAAERSLMDHNVKTIGDLSKLTAVKASALKSLKPPSNLVAIKEALRKFEKSWMKRGKDKYTEKKLLNNPSAMVEVEEELLDVDILTGQEVKEQSPTAAPVVDVSTPEEEDEAMKEIYERPSPSPTESVGSSIEAEIKDETKELVQNTVEEEEHENKEALDEASSIDMFDKDEVTENEITDSEKEVIDKTIEKAISKVVTDASVATEEKQVNDAVIMTDKKELSDACCETDAKEKKDFEQQTDKAEDKSVEQDQEASIIEITEKEDIIEKELTDASVATDEKEVNDAFVMTEKKEFSDVHVETDAKENQDFEQQTENVSAKTKLKEFLDVMKELSICDLTEVISRAAQAIRDKDV